MPVRNPSVASTAPATSPSAAGVEATPAPVAPTPEAPRAPPDDPETTDAAPVDLAAAGRHCAWGKVDACLRAADALDADSSARDGDARAFAFRQRARTLALRACEGTRDPLPCLQAARLLAAGTGGPSDPSQARVLADRAAELCAARPTAACAGLDAGRD